MQYHVVRKIVWFEDYDFSCTHNKIRIYYNPENETGNNWEVLSYEPTGEIVKMFNLAKWFIFKLSTTIYILYDYIYSQRVIKSSYYHDLLIKITREYT